MSKRISHNYLYVLGGLLIVISLGARIFSYPVATVDFTDSLAPWMQTLSSHPGLSAFKDPFSDYAPLYLYLLKFLTVLPLPALYAVKTLSVIFDVILAFVVCAIAKRSGPDRFGKPHLFAVFAIAFTIPTVLVNSSLWGQCDSIYTAFVLATLLYIIERKPFAAALCFAFAFCFKLQAIFFLPVFLGFILTQKNRVAYILLVPALYGLLVIPAIGGGGSLSRLLTIYFHQSGEYQALTLSAPTIYSFLPSAGLSQSAQTALSYAGILITLVLAGWIGLAVMRGFNREKAEPARGLTSRQLVSASLFTVLALPFLLPHMHERYFYLADVISVVYAVYDPRAYYVPVAVILASLMSYLPFLSASLPVLASAKLNIAILGGLVFLVILTLVPGMISLWKRYSTV